MNSTRFCIDHYNLLKIWVGGMSPEFVDYHKQRYQCLKSTGVPYGRDYCLDINKYSLDATKQDLYACYRKHKVNFAKEFCE